VHWLEVLGLAFGLATDAFAVAVAVGLSLPELSGRRIFRLAWHFGLFQFLMPVAGWVGGQALARHTSTWGTWLAAGLLLLLGGKMLYQGLRGGAERPQAKGDPTRGLSLVTLSVATSLDALVVGLSMAMLQVSVLAPALVIGLVTGGLTILGLQFGRRIGARCGRAADLLGGLVLVAIAVRFLW
jgi:manganese efflux pump family protein